MVMRGRDQGTQDEVKELTPEVEMKNVGDEW
jgi:hypothetical protein